MDEVIAGVAEQKEKLSLESSKLTEETKNISQTTAAIKGEIKDFQQQTKGYLSEVKRVTATSGQMNSIVKTINGFATRMEIGEGFVSDNAKSAQNSLVQMQATGEELAQTLKDFDAVVKGVTSQREKLDTSLKKVAEWPNFKVQADSLQKVLNDLETVSNKLSAKVFTVQNSFDAKLEGMDLSFGTLEKDFSELSLKVEDVKKILEKIVAKNQERKMENKKE